MTRRTYKCKCGTVEVSQRMSEPPLKICPQCKEEYKQIFHVPTFVNLTGIHEISRRNAMQILEKGW